MKKQLVALMLTAGMVTSCLAGCGQEDSKGNSETGSEAGVTETASSEADTTPEVKDPVTLEWYYRGNGIQTDTQAVNDRVNELLKEYPGLEHVTVNLNPFAASDYANGVLLAQTSGEQIDILGSVSLNYLDEVNNGTYLALDDYLATDEFAELAEVLPDWLWEAMEVNGSVYAVPNYQRGANRQVLQIPTEYVEYADIDMLEELLDSGCKTVEDIEKLAAELEKITLAIREEKDSDTQYMWRLPYTYQHDYGIGGYKDKISGGFCMFDGTTEVVNIYLTEEFKKCCEIVADWYERGLIKQDVLVANMDDYIKTNVMNDEAIPVYFEAVIVPLEEEIFEASQGDIATTNIPIHDNYFMVNSWGAGGNGVTASCEHPEEALLFLQAINGGSELGTEIYNTIVYGLEGKHYEKIDDTHIKTLEYDSSQGGGDTTYAAMKWIMGNTFNAWLNQSCNDSDMERDLAINSNPDNIISPLMGFRFDSTNVQTQLEQCAAVVTEYELTLQWGAKGADWESYYNEFVAKLEAAGYQAVIDEMQSQYDAWAAANN